MATENKTASADKNADASQEKLESMENLTPSTPENSEDENLALIKELESENLKLQEELDALKKASESSEEFDVESLSIDELTDLVSTRSLELTILQKTLNAKLREEDKAALIAAEKDDKRPVFKDNRGLTFRFKRSAPKTLNIDGKATKLEEIIKNKEVMNELIYGNSNYVEQKHI